MLITYRRLTNGVSYTVFQSLYVEIAGSTILPVFLLTINPVSTLSHTRQWLGIFFEIVVLLLGEKAKPFLQPRGIILQRDGIIGKFCLHRIHRRVHAGQSHLARCRRRLSLLLLFGGRTL